MAHHRTIATRGTGEATMNINGRTYSKYLTKIIFKCAVCFSDLRYRDAGLACSVDPAHRGFIHRNEAKQIQAEQDAALIELQQFYEIKNGIVVIKE